jgi:hypothetical protein
MNGLYHRMETIIGGETLMHGEVHAEASSIVKRLCSASVAAETGVRISCKQESQASIQLYCINSWNSQTFTARTAKFAAKQFFLGGMRCLYNYDVRHGYDNDYTVVGNYAKINFFHIDLQL